MLLTGAVGVAATVVEDGNGNKDAHERVADSPDRERQIQGSGVGERGENHVQDPLEARSEERLQADGGRGALQGQSLYIQSD